MFFKFIHALFMFNNRVLLQLGDFAQAFSYGFYAIIVFFVGMLQPIMFFTHFLRKISTFHKYLVNHGFLLVYSFSVFQHHLSELGLIGFHQCVCRYIFHFCRDFVMFFSNDFRKAIHHVRKAGDLRHGHSGRRI